VADFQWVMVYNVPSEMGEGFYLLRRVATVKLTDRQCVWCGRMFSPVRIDQRFDQRECLDRWFVAERKQALVAYREMQRMNRTTAFFNQQRSEDVDAA
jgi:hypothetical protein